VEVGVVGVKLATLPVAVEVWVVATPKLPSTKEQKPLLILRLELLELLGLPQGVMVLIQQLFKV
jgi:hypothetical protein